MTKLPIGARIRIIGNHNNHDYQIGGIYRIHQIADFGCFSAIDEKGNIGRLAQWRDCERVGIGWEWLRTQLDERSLALLSGFAGKEHLTLKPEVESQLLLSLPHLDDSILRVLPKIDTTTQLTNSSLP
jgi:hypothetical protein